MLAAAEPVSSESAGGLHVQSSQGMAANSLLNKAVLH